AKLTDGLEHGVTDRVSVFFLTDEAVADKGLDSVEDLDLGERQVLRGKRLGNVYLLETRADRLSRFERRPARKDAHARQKRLLLRRQKIKRPGDRAAKRLLALGKIAASAGE